LTTLEQPHPPSITQQDVIQQCMNAAERSRTLLPVLVVIQLSTGCVQPLVRNAIVSREQLKVSRQIHSTQIKPIQAGKRSLLRNSSSATQKESTSARRTPTEKPDKEHLVAKW
jgi:hypothetical protein